LGVDAVGVDEREGERLSLFQIESGVSNLKRAGDIDTALYSEYRGGTVARGIRRQNGG